MKKSSITLQHQFIGYMIGSTALVLCFSLAFSIWIQHDLGKTQSPTESALLMELAEATGSPTAATIPATNINAQPTTDSTALTAAKVSTLAAEGINTIKSDLVATTQRNYLALILLVLIAQLIGSILWVKRMLVQPLYSTIQKIDTLAKEDYSLVPCSDGPHELDHLNHQLYVLSEEMRKSKLYREAEAAKKKALIAGMSHDLKTPLTNICGYAETLLMEETAEPEHHEWLAIILRNAQMANRLISDLLDLNRYDLDQHPINKSSVRIDTLIQSCIDDAFQLLEQNCQHATLVFSSSESTVEQNADWSVVTDPVLMMRLIKNIISNFNRHAGVNTTLTIEAAITPSHFTLQFSDDGVGVPAHEVANLTDIFYIGDQARSNPGSSGLGLYNCQQIIDLLEGTLELKSDTNQGMTLRVDCPIL